jgi:hypothetical protein
VVLVAVVRMIIMMLSSDKAVLPPKNKKELENRPE